MKRRMSEETAIGIMLSAIIVIAVGIWVFQSSVERDVWNKCHPSHSLTLWETMWSTTRIDNCEVE